VPIFLRLLLVTTELFTGKVDGAKVFPYPDVLTEEDRDTARMLVDPVRRFMDEKVDSKKIDRDAKIPDAVLDGLKGLGVFGLQIPTDLGGLGLSNTAYARVAEEVGRDGAIATTLLAHQSIGLKGILLNGNDQQKEKYLPRLASGEHIASFALTEPSAGSDAAAIKTRATLSADGKHWILNGSKIWISNGGWAQIFTGTYKPWVYNIVMYRSIELEL
jgi:acyl-CoA dehydrogenase family protein 9